MAAEKELDATSYIQHHLTFFAQPVSETGGFWTIHYDTIVTSIIVGVLVLGFIWLVTRKATSGVPSKTQAFVELTVEFINDQVKSLFHHDYRVVAPIALTVFLWVLFMNAMDFLPVDVMAWIYQHVFHLHEWRSVPTADVNTTFALSLSVFGLMIFYSIKVKGLGGWLHELLATPFGIKPLWLSPLLVFFNLLFNLIEYISKPLSHSLRLYGNMYAGEIIFLLLGLWAATGITGVVVGGLLHLGWSIFHILIVALQAYIFMMLTVVYIAMAHEHH
ncbi:MAG TPA: F0F1 ATP synthase subunit A [Casimicrobiaceae bacterium]|jgi:F-type H+-transporting ATPase subunit a|nr:F0F1 ATP synthase subunit A [Casimicrobiaceae bacterium]